MTEPHRVSLEHRQHVLMMAVSAQTSRGAQVVSMGPTYAELTHIEDVNHLLYLVLSVVTCGIGLIAWFIKVHQTKIHRYRIVVDEFGVVSFTAPSTVQYTRFG